MQFKKWPVVLVGFSFLAELSSAAPLVRSIGKYATTHYNDKAALTISSQGDALTISLISGGKSLTLVKSSFGDIYVLRRTVAGRAYEFYLKEDKKFGIRKVGFIPLDEVTLYSEKCEKSQPWEKLDLQMKAVTSFIGSEDIDVTSILDPNCSEQVQALKLKRRASEIAKQMRPQDNYLVQCLSNEKAVTQLSKITSLQDSLPTALGNLLKDMEQFKKGEKPFKISCEPQNESKPFNAKYKSKSSEMVFSTKNKDMDVGDCFNTESLFSHEYLHRAGITNEKQIQIIEAICASANNLEGFSNPACIKSFSMKACIDKPESCNQMGVSTALKAAVSKDADKQRKEVNPALEKEISNIKMDQVSVGKEVGVAKISEIPTNTSYSQAPQEQTSGSSGETTGSGMQTVATTMQRNLNRFSSAVDAAFSAASTKAYASAEDAASKRDTNSNEPKSRSIKTLQKRSIATVTGRNNTEEYIAEEIIADKFSIPVEKVREVAANSRDSEVNSSATALSSSGKTATDVATSTPASTPASTVGSRVLALGNGEIRQQRKVASVESPKRDNTSNTLGARTEFLGSEYETIRSKYVDAKFVDQITSENIQIILVRERKKIGSNKSDATIFVDTGHSLIRKK